MTYSVSCKICFVDTIKGKISTYVRKTSLTEKSLFRKTLLLAILNQKQFEGVVTEEGFKLAQGGSVSIGSTLLS